MCQQFCLLSLLLLCIFHAVGWVSTYRRCGALWEGLKELGQSGQDWWPPWQLIAEWFGWSSCTEMPRQRVSLPDTSSSSNGCLWRIGGVVSARLALPSSSCQYFSIVLVRLSQLDFLPSNRWTEIKGWILLSTLTLNLEPLTGLNKPIYHVPDSRQLNLPDFRTLLRLGLNRVGGSFILPLNLHFDECL